MDEKDNGAESLLFKNSFSLSVSLSKNKSFSLSHSCNNNLNSHMPFELSVLQRACCILKENKHIFFARYSPTISHRLRFHENNFLSTTHKSARESWLIESKVEILFLYLLAKWNFHFFCGIFLRLCYIARSERRLHFDFWIWI